MRTCCYKGTEREKKHKVDEWISKRRPQRILHKAEATGGFPEFVEAHDDSFDVASPREQLMNLLLCGVVWQIANIQCAAGQQGSLLFLTTSLKQKDTVVMVRAVCKE